MTSPSSIPNKGTAIVFLVMLTQWVGEVWLHRTSAVNFVTSLYNYFSVHSYAFASGIELTVFTYAEKLWKDIE